MEACYYMSDVLDAVHSIIKLNNVTFDADAIEKVDKEIESYIRERISIVDPKKRHTVSSKYKDLKIPRSDFVDIVLQYYAIANDNVRILEILRSRGFIFTESNRIKLYLLDKNFVNKFPFNKYIDLLVKEDLVLRRFYNLVHNLTEEEKNKYTDMFSEIICSKPNLCIDNSKSGSYDEGFLTSLLSPRNLEFFGKDFLMNTNIKQRRIIDSLGAHLREEHLIKVRDLLIKYPEFDCNINLYPELLDVLSVDEIASMSTKDIFLYSKAMSRGYNLVERMHNVLLINPNFICSEYFIRPEIFKSMSDEVIAGLTPHGIEAIEQIKIPLIDNVYVMPIRKVNRAVLKDEKLKKKLAKEEAKKHR